MLGDTLWERKESNTETVSIWDMAVRMRGDRKERLARAAELRRKVSAHFVLRHISAIKNLIDFFILYLIGGLLLI